MPKLDLYQSYSRQQAHAIFAPDTPFTPQSGTWGIQGIIAIPDRPGDFVFFVTFGKQQAEHTFDEGITADGVLSWQSQPRQAIQATQIQTFINHDELINTIYLFLRTTDRTPYTFLGPLKYISHDTERERPVWFQWQLLDWPVPTSVLTKIGLRLQPSDPTVAADLTPDSATINTLEQVPQPKTRLRQGKRTQEFRSRKVPDYEANNARNRAVGLAGEELVLAYEMQRLIDSGCISLARKIRHVSAMEGDGAGYDILSYEVDGTERYIEVKTSTGNSDATFFMTSNEVAFAESHIAQYFLFRVFDFDSESRTGKFYIHTGNLKENFILSATQFRVSPANY